MNFSVLKEWAPLVLALAASWASFKVIEYRVEQTEVKVAALETVGTPIARKAVGDLEHIKDELSILRSQRDADRQFLLSVAQDLKLFMCAQDKIYCKK